MKDIRAIQKIWLEDYDVYVNPYLTYPQIQQIVTDTKGFQDWSTRQTNIDILLLYHVTDIGKEMLEKYTHDELVSSGLIAEVYKVVKNIDQLYEAMKWTEGATHTERLVGEFLQQMNSAINKAMLEQLVQEQKNGKQSNK